MSNVQALNLSHLVITSQNVTKITEFFQNVFGVDPHYANSEFSDFVLPSGTRVAFFKPVGASSKFFSLNDKKDSLAIGITVRDIHEFYTHCQNNSDKYNLKFSGPPKEHPWGEPSFLLIDGDGNRWEVTQSPTKEGKLVNLE